MIGHIVDGLASCGVRKIAVVTGYLGALIEAWCETFNRSRADVRLTIFRQAELNGTAGALLAAQPFVQDQSRFLFGWSDILMAPANYRRFLDAATKTSYDLLLAVNAVEDPWRGAAVYVGNDMTVEKVIEKPPPRTSGTGWNSAGLFAASPVLFEYARLCKPSQRGELELTEAIATMLASGKHSIRAVEMTGFWSDVGSVDDLTEARARFTDKLESDARRR